MARPKSDDKRNAILTAAIATFAARGVWSTPTSAISKAAGIAEGTLFTYFGTKELLVNELYRALKLELADVLLTDFPATADLRGKLRHIWERYVDWGVDNPAKLRVLAQLNSSDQVSEQSKAVGSAPFALIEQLATDSIARGEIYPYPVEFVAALLNGMAETTIMALAHSGGAIDYRAAGFEVLWRGLAKP